MNNTMLSEEDIILNAAIQSLNGQIKPDEVAVVNGEGINGNFDAVVRIKGIEFICEIKINVTDTNLNCALQQLLHYKKTFNKPVILVAKYIYPELMNRLAEQGINSLDSAGNCIIRHNDILLSIKGQKNAPAKETTNRAFQETGLKLIFHFLRFHESVSLPYRAIQEKTDISLGSIKKVMEELIRDHFVLVTNNGRFLKNKKKLLQRWVDAYNQTLKPKLLLEQMTFLSNDKRDKWMAMALPEGMYWGGEPGANLVNNYLYPGAFDIYSDVPAKTLLPTGFVMPKAGGEIKIYRKFWRDKSENHIVPTLLIYADLMGSGNSRNLEMAQKIYDYEFSDFE
jgi:hypothetical protein